MKVVDCNSFNVADTWYKVGGGGDKGAYNLKNKCGGPGREACLFAV